MKKHYLIFLAAILSLALVNGCSETKKLGGIAELLTSLTQLGVTSDQATAGFGAIMSLAQGKLDAAEFAKIAGALPGLDGIMKKAADLGIVSQSITTMGGIEEAFTKLGMNKEMIEKFIPIIVKFVSAAAGPEVGNLLSNILK